jgi:hypothetical protein
LHVALFQQLLHFFSALLLVQNASLVRLKVANSYIGVAFEFLLLLLSSRLGLLACGELE